MKRVSIATVVVLAALPLLVLLPASAHAPDFTIAGYQYVYSLQFEDTPGVAGYVNTPAGPTQVSDGAVADSSINSITNRDAVQHSFSELRAEGSRFTITLPGGAATTPDQVAAVNAVLADDLSKQGPTSYTIYCRIHSFMRGRLTTTGG